jgi:predicted phage baseplate assembly protein
MALPAPNLDDRTFQDIVNEVRSRIPYYTPEWTDHNLSDPGITLIELFAWMTETILYRLNKTPDKNYIKFLELLGVRLTPASPASAEITFKLSVAQPGPVVIPEGTEVATVRTETQEAVVFTTDEAATIEPPTLDHFLVTQDHARFDDRLVFLQGPDAAQQGADDPAARGFDLFQNVRESGNAFYLGYSHRLPGTVLSATLDCAELGAPGVNPSNPPLRWEYWDEDEYRWVPFSKQSTSEAWLEADETRGLNQRGRVVLHVPREAGKTLVNGREAYWLRCLLTPWTPEQGSYEVSPRLRSLISESIGGRALASNAARVAGEVLGVSNGKPGQAMRASRTPMLALRPDETVEVERTDGAGWEAWEQVADFSESGPDDKHFVCDPVNGEVQFGPLVRSPGGRETRHGAVPPRGAHVRLGSYRAGGGAAGNVGRDTLTVLVTSIPFIASVTNRPAATGGADPEGIESAKLRGPRVLRTRDRAVTEEDFEYLALRASPAVARARCIQPRELGADGAPLPGVINVLLVPAVPFRPQRLTPQDLDLPREVFDEVAVYLDERRLLTTAVMVDRPSYVWVSIEARVRARRGLNPGQIQAAVEERLYRFIHPVYGGQDGAGWPFGRSLFLSDVFAQVQSLPGVEYVEDLRIVPVNALTGERGEAAQSVHVPSVGVLCSHVHTVTVV